MRPSRLLLYGRAGFEKEAAQEIMAAAGAMGVEGFVKAKPESGFAVFHPHQDDMGVELGKHLEFRRLVFPRQVVRVGDLLADLPEGDRVTPIVAAAKALGRSFAALWIETPDTNDGKSLASLIKPLAPHLEKGLAKAGVRFDDAAAEERLHVFFVGGRAAYVGVSAIANSSPWPMGIPRLRMPSAAPSRSTLKLGEALLEFLDEKERAKRLVPGMTAIDLGASPGGWTYQLVQRGLMVLAVDNGAMDPALMESGQVKHRRDDGFHFMPTDPVDWMVCDMVESPSKIARLAAKWIAQGWTRETIFNLKLPMKKRWEELERCRGIIDEALGGGGYYLRMKHLYHDREEVTVYLARRGKDMPAHGNGREEQ
jgi:23S rRNA (cytidine2498-2'-O)-methyltransferase